LYSPGWLRASVDAVIPTDTPFLSLNRLCIDAEPVPTSLHVTDEFLASILPLMRRLTRLQLRSLIGVTGAGWRNNLHFTNTALVSLVTSVSSNGAAVSVLPLKRKDTPSASDAMDTNSVG
jgi:hypothetical protein